MQSRTWLGTIMVVVIAASGLLWAQIGWCASEVAADADAALKRLASSLKSSRAVNEDILAYLDEVAGFYHHEGWDDGVPEREKFRKKAEKLYLKALVLVRIRRPSGENIRDGVNVRAAEILGATGNRAVSKDLIRALERSLFKAKHPVPQQVWEAAFFALAELGDLASLEWMIHEFTHTKSSPPVVVDQLTAAHVAMVRFARVPGTLRYEVVSEMVKTYAGVEAQVRNRAPDAERFWGRVRNGVIAALQHFSGQPLNAEGEALATVLEFQHWFREHKKPRRSPW